MHKLHSLYCTSNKNERELKEAAAEVVLHIGRVLNAGCAHNQSDTFI